MKFVRDTSRFWYKPTISREEGIIFHLQIYIYIIQTDILYIIFFFFKLNKNVFISITFYIFLTAIAMLRNQQPGTFVVRDSNSFSGAFGLALKVATPPPSTPVKNSSTDPSSELVRHFLIEPTSRGVKLKGCANEPVFSK